MIQLAALSFALGVGSPASRVVAPAETAPLELDARIESLWRQAGTHWDTANYLEAIEVYEQGLTLAVSHQHWSAPHLQVALAESHLRQYFVDDNAQHLGKSRELFRDFSRRAPAQVNDDLSRRAELGLAEAERRLREHRERGNAVVEAPTRPAGEAPKGDESEEPSQPAAQALRGEGDAAPKPVPNHRRGRALSIAGLGMGLGVLGAGLGLMVHGTRVESIGRAQVGTQGLAPNQRAYLRGLERDLLVSGAVLSTLGVGLSVAGAVGLARLRKRPALSVRAGFASGTGMLELSGRF